jgi:predicted metalloendopeptidase
MLKKYKKVLDPGDNFYLYINNNWLKKTHIPEYTSSFSVNEEIQESIDAKLFKILDDCETFVSKGRVPINTKIKEVIGRLILSSMRVKVQKNSILLLKQKIQNLHCIRNIDDIGEVLGYLCKHKIPTILGTYLQLERTKDNISIYNLVLAEGVLGLPDDTYYKATAPGKLKTLYAYIQLVKNVCKLLDIQDLSSVIPLESFFSANISDKKYKNDILYKGSELIKNFPKFPWNSFFIALGIENYLEHTLLKYFFLKHFIILIYFIKIYYKIF